MKYLCRLLIIIGIIIVPYVYALDDVRVTMEINDTKVKKLVTIDKLDKDSKINIPISGDIPSSNYGFTINMGNIDTLYKKDDKYIYLDKKDKIRLKYEYEVSFLQNNNKAYYDIFDGIDDYVNKIDFTITFLDNYEIRDLNFYINGKKVKKVDYYIRDNMIVGNIDKKINKGDKLSFMVNKKPQTDYGLLTKLSLIFPLFSLVVSYIIWIIFGKDRQVKSERSMHPDKRLSILDVSRLYNGKVTKNDVILLVFSLCHKGFIKIEETKDDIRLIRLKKYNGHCYSEGILFDAIFTKRKIGTLSEIIESFKKVEFEDSVSVKNVMVSKTIERILANENMTDKKYEYFERSTQNKEKIIMGLCVISLLLITCNPFIKFNVPAYMAIGVFVSAFSYYLVYQFVKYVRFDKIEDYKLPIIIICFFLILVFSFLLGTRSVYQLIYFIGIVSVIIMMILAKYMPKRTIYGSKLMGKMEGFKEFLDTAKDDEITRVLEVNPSYYYDIMEYLYFYNIKDSVSKKFKKSDRCEWFDSYKEYKYNKFNDICDIVYQILKEKN